MKNDHPSQCWGIVQNLSKIDVRLNLLAKDTLWYNLKTSSPPGVMLPGMPSTLLTCSVTLNDGFRSTKLCFPLLQNGDANPHFPGLVWSSVTHTVPDLEWVFDKCLLSLALFCFHKLLVTWTYRQAGEKYFSVHKPHWQNRIKPQWCWSFKVSHKDRTCEQLTESSRAFSRHLALNYMM